MHIVKNHILSLKSNVCLKLKFVITCIIIIREFTTVTYKRVYVNFLRKSLWIVYITSLYIPVFVATVTVSLVDVVLDISSKK